MNIKCSRVLCRKKICRDSQSQSKPLFGEGQIVTPDFSILEERRETSVDLRCPPIMTEGMIDDW